MTIKKIGVFVNEDFEMIKKIIDDYNLYAVQLHGDETKEFCFELMNNTKVIKVFRLKGEENIDQLVQPFQNACHYYMFDTANSISPERREKEEYGGTGRKFNWNILQNAKINKPFF